MTWSKVRRAFGRAALLLLGLGLLIGAVAAQDDLVVRPGPPPLEDFETDADKDGIPDGWYNPRDFALAKDGPVGPTCVRFENDKPGRPARLSRAFGLDGRKTEALVIGLWVKAGEIGPGERVGEEPGIMLSFLGPELRATGRAMLGPWNEHTLGRGWVHIARRVAVPPDTLDAIMTVGLLGSTGVLDVDGLTIEEIPVGGKPTTNLIRNGDFELGDPEPSPWVLDGARRVSPGFRSDAAVELTKSGARLMTAIGGRVDRYAGLLLGVAARGSGLRPSGGAQATVYFLDEDGKPLGGPNGAVRLFRFSGSFDWQAQRTEFAVPRGAVRAVLQFEKAEGQGGALRIDDVVVTPAGDAVDRDPWTPYHVADDTTGWLPYEPAATIEPGSALDASGLVPAPAGRSGFVTVKDGRLHFARGGRARFFGVALLPPLSFPDVDRAEAMAERLARSGVNLVRFHGLGAPFGPTRSLFDDARDDTRAFDPTALERFDHLVAELKKRGIYISLEIQAMRRFRGGDEVPGGSRLPLGGGPAAAFDPTIRERTIETAKALLTHVNPETKLALKDDPVFAWVVVAGELSLFDLIEEPDALPEESAAVLRGQSEKSRSGAGRKFWQATEAAQWTAEADALRTLGVKVPIAGGSHWRREPPEWVAAQTAPGLDLIDDRLYWTPPVWGVPDRRSMVFDTNGGLAHGAAKRRRQDRPFAVGEWCARIGSAWALPYEGADLMLAARTAAGEDWDGLVRRGIFLNPAVWGAAAPGTSGGDDIFQVSEALNANPSAFALLPHAASLFLRHESTDASAPAPAGGRPRTHARGTWDPRRGRLVLDAPHTQGVVGWPGPGAVTTEALGIEVENSFAVVVASSLAPEPIDRAKRLLVTAIGRSQPTGLTWADESRMEAASPGRPPIVLDPIAGSVVWKRQGRIKAYALDNSGKRAHAVELVPVAGGVRLPLDGKTATVHWELVAE